MINDQEDLPYGENFHDEREAAEWADSALQKRPWRPQIFDQFATAVTTAHAPAPRVLELGSGPGFLAEHVLDRCVSIARYTLLDFSRAMLGLSRDRLTAHVDRTAFIQADFKSETWPIQCDGLFDFVFSHQAVHELRHKRHAPRLYAQVRPLLSATGQLLVCDHLPAAAITPQHRRLYMEIDEYLVVLRDAGFRNAEVVWTAHEMALYRAEG